MPVWFTELIDQVSYWMHSNSGSELGYAFLIFLLFVVPRFLLRMGIPMALTAFALGIIAKFGFGFYDNDNVIPIFSTLGIISLFLFAGLEVDLFALRKSLRPILAHIGFRAVVVVLLVYMIIEIHSLSPVTAILLALALATPSAGFILNSIETSNLSDNLKYWIKLKAISAELIALGALLLLSQSGSFLSLSVSVLTICIMVLVLPLLIRRLASSLEKVAPGSEFSFILMLAIISGLITKKLGAYYLVGAFLVGMATGQYKRNASDSGADQILKSLQSFSIFFMPFYFFYSGLRMPADALSLEALQVAVVFMVISAPIKIGSIILHRKISLGESWKDSVAVAVSLMPNLVFGLVLAEILKTKMGIPVSIYGGLIIYTLFTTLVSPIVLGLLPDTKPLEVLAVGTEAFEFNTPYSNPGDNTIPNFSNDPDDSDDSGSSGNSGNSGNSGKGQLS